MTPSRPSSLDHPQGVVGGPERVGHTGQSLALADHGVVVYRMDTPDGPDLVAYCPRCHGAGPTISLRWDADVRSAVDRLRKIGCEACRVQEQASSRGTAVERLFCVGALVEVV